MEFTGKGLVSICSTAWDSLKLGLSGMSGKQATISHKCSKCGNVDEVQVSPAAGGLNVGFGSDSGSGLSTLCPWKVK